MKKLFSLIASAALMLTSAPPHIRAHSSENMTDSGINYTETVETIQNPGAGYTTTVWAVCRPGDTRVYSPTGSLVLFFIDIGAFSSGVNGTTDEDGTYTEGTDYDLDDTFFDAWRATFRNCRKNGCMVAVRFRYDAEGKADPEPATFDKVLDHIRQIQDSRLLYDNRDILAFVESGFVGKWGEQHGGKYTTVEYKAKLLEAMLKAVPAPTPVTVRTPDTFAKFLGIDRSELDDPRYYTQNNGSLSSDTREKNVYIPEFDRVGLYDDGYMGSSSDLGTYADRTAETNWLNMITQHTYFGGEFSGNIEYATQFDTYLPENAIPEMYKTRLSYINGNIFPLYNDYIFGKEYDTGNKDNTAYYGQTVFRFIRDHIGYRYVIRKAENTAGSEQGGTLTLKFDLENTGFADPVFDTAAHIILEKDGVIYAAPVRFKDNDKQSQDRISCVLQLHIPDCIDTGDWNIYLRLSPLASLFDTKKEVTEQILPRYGIRFANEGVWNSQLGANYLGRIKITDAHTVGTENGFYSISPCRNYEPYTRPYTLDGSTVTDGKLSTPREWQEKDLILTKGEQTLSVKADEEALYVMAKLPNDAAAPVYNLEWYSGGERSWLYYASNGYVYFNRDSYAGCRCECSNGIVEFRIPFEVLGLGPDENIESLRVFLQDSSDSWKLLGDMTSKNVLIPSELTVYSAPHSIRIPENAPFTLSVSVPKNDMQYLWYLNGSPIDGADRRDYTIISPDSSCTGTYSVQLTNAEGVRSMVKIADIVGVGDETPTKYSELRGDTNCDNNVDLSDAILIMQALSNPNKYGENGTDSNHLTHQGRINGDVQGGRDGLTGDDAVEIQRFLIGLTDKFE